MKNHYLPPEWHPQQAVLLTWPHLQSDWAPLIIEVEQVFVQIAHRIAEREELIIVCYDKKHKERISALLSPFLPHKISYCIVRSDDTWARDHGPITVLTGKKRHILDFTYNAWGEKFSAAYDDKITAALHEQGVFGKIKRDQINFVLEGGSIEVNGEGALLTTTECLLSKKRNPHLTRDEIEGQLSLLLGVEHFLWLDHGYLAGDDTDSHIDTLARFTDANTICYVQCHDIHDEHYKELRLMEEQLRSFLTVHEEPFNLVPLPWPSPKYNSKGLRLPATYANFLIINDAVLVPTYDDEMDNVALSQIKNCFPNRKIIGINCNVLIEQGGSLHCVTMQIPKADAN